jgi:hypothetical protein
MDPAHPSNRLSIENSLVSASAPSPNSVSCCQVTRRPTSWLLWPDSPKKALSPTAMRARYILFSGSRHAVPAGAPLPKP